MRKSTLFRVALAIVVVFAAFGLIEIGEPMALVGTELGSYVAIGTVVGIIALLARVQEHTAMELYRKWRRLELTIWSNKDWPYMRPI